MDGGIGEAALMGAIIGGGSSAITGGDPLKGALMGGLGGGLFGGMSGEGGIGSLLGSSESSAPAFAYNAAGEMVPANYAPAITGATNIPATTGGSSFFGAGNPFLKNDSMDTSSIKGAWNSLSGLGKAGVIGGGGLLASQMMQPKTSGAPPVEKYSGPLSKFRYDPSSYTPDVVTPPNPVYRPVYAADGGLMDTGGIAGLSNNPNFPMAQQQNSRYAVASQMPIGAQDIRMANLPPTAMATGGIADLGGYSDGGRLLKGPGDGVSDDIPASIGQKQPARLADGEFVLPARIVSEIGNGSTDAGARELYKMMDRIQSGRKKSIGKQKVAVDTKAKKHLPA